MATINGTTGNDTLSSNATGDVLVGGVGNDTYIVDDAQDVVVETVSSNSPLGETGSLTRISTTADGTQANASVTVIGVSSDGQNLLLQSTATNLDSLTPNVVPSAAHLFIKNLTTGAITRVTTAADGTLANAGLAAGAGLGFLSADGQKVFLSSTASNLVANDTNTAADIFPKNLRTGVMPVS